LVLDEATANVDPQ